MRFLAALLLLPGCFVFQSLHPAALPAGAKEILGVSYYRGLEREEKHALNVWVPQGPGPHPVLLFVHGGSFNSGDRDGDFYAYHRFGRRMVKRNILTVVISYRLAPEHMHPEHVQDVVRSVESTFGSVARYGGDPNRVYLMGHSSGAHLVMLAVCDPRWLGVKSPLAGVIGVSGPYDLTLLAKEYPQIVVDAFGPKIEVWRAASANAYLGKDIAGRVFPPFLIAVAEDDPRILHVQAEHFTEALTNVGARVQRHRSAERGHYTIMARLGEPGDSLGDRIVQFIGERDAP